MSERDRERGREESKETDPGRWEPSTAETSKPMYPFSSIFPRHTFPCLRGAICGWFFDPGMSLSRSLPSPGLFLCASVYYSAFSAPPPPPGGGGAWGVTRSGIMSGGRFNFGGDQGCHLVINSAMS